MAEITTTVPGARSCLRPGPEFLRLLQLLTKFWEVVGEKLAERWLAIVGPAAVLWGVALGLWLKADVTVFWSR